MFQQRKDFFLPQEQAFPEFGCLFVGQPALLDGRLDLVPSLERWPLVSFGQLDV